MSDPVHCLLTALGARLDGPQLANPPEDWSALLSLAEQNRVSALLQSVLPSGLAPQELVQMTRRSFVAATLAAETLRPLSQALDGIPWLLLRGPALGAHLYGDLMLRPFGDLDVLVRPDDADRAISALTAAGFTQTAGSLPISYYRRYHLHVELRQPKSLSGVSTELHWALDHPFTLLTPNINQLIERGQTVFIGANPIRIPGQDDLFLTLAVHFVKHAVLLPIWLADGKVTEVVNSGHLLSLFDLALAVRQPGLRWDAIASQAADWGATGLVRDCLESLDAMWPDKGLGTYKLAFPRTFPTGWRRLVYRWAAQREGALRLRRDVFFRPIRLLDSVDYLIPPDDFLRRRYSRAGWRVRAVHAARSLAVLASGSLTLMHQLALRR